MIDRTYKLVIDREEGAEKSMIVPYLQYDYPMRTMSFDVVLFYDYDERDEMDYRERQRLCLLNEILAKYEKKFSEELKNPVKIINIIDGSQWEPRD